jgi:ABC-type sugar transport system substrate-binding protein
VLVGLLSEHQEFQRMQAEDARSTGARRNLDVEVVFAENNAVLQIQQLYAAIHAAAEERPAAIVVETVAGEGLERVARKAAASGIGWVLINRSVPYLEDLRRQHPRLPLSTVGTDQLEVGRIHGAQLKAIAPRGGMALCVTGPADTSVAQQRLKGLQQAVEGAGIELKVLEGRWSEASGEESLRRWLRLESSREVRVEAVVCQNDAMAVGARRALDVHRGAGGATPVPVVGCDGLADGGRRLVDAGTLAATVVTPSNAGPAVQLVARALHSGAPTPPAVQLPPVPYPTADELKRRLRGSPSA